MFRMPFGFYSKQYDICSDRLVCPICEEMVTFHVAHVKETLYALFIPLVPYSSKTYQKCLKCAYDWPVRGAPSDTSLKIFLVLASAFYLGAIIELGFDFWQLGLILFIAGSIISYSFIHVLPSTLREFRPGPPPPGAVPGPPHLRHPGVTPPPVPAPVPKPAPSPGPAPEPTHQVDIKGASNKEQVCSNCAQSIERYGPVDRCPFCEEPILE